MVFDKKSPSPSIANDANEEDTIPITTTISKKVLSASNKYCKDYGHRKIQDVIRLALANLLKKEGYL